MTDERGSRGSRFALPNWRREALSNRGIGDDDRSAAIMASSPPSSSSGVSQRLGGNGPLLHRNGGLLLERHRHEGFGKAPGFDVVDSHRAVESRRCHMSAVGRKNQGIDPTLVTFEARHALASVRLVDPDLVGRAAHDYPMAVRTES